MKLTVCSVKPGALTTSLCETPDVTASMRGPVTGLPSSTNVGDAPSGVTFTSTTTEPFFRSSFTWAGPFVVLGLQRDLLAGVLEAVHRELHVERDAGGKLRDRRGRDLGAEVAVDPDRRAGRLALERE